MNKLLENSKVQLTTVVVVGVFIIGVIVSDQTWKVHVSRDLHDIREYQLQRGFDRDEMERWVLRTELLNRQASNPWKGAEINDVQATP